MLNLWFFFQKVSNIIQARLCVLLVYVEIGHFYTISLDISTICCMLHLQIHHLTTSCLPNTCIILDIIAKLKIFVTFFSGTTIQGFLKFGFKVCICQLYCVMHFQIYHSQNYPLAAGVSSLSSSSQFHLFLFVSL